MAYRQEEEAHAVLGNLFPLFHSATLEGVRDYQREYGPNAHRHSIRSIRNIIRDHIVDRLRFAVDGMPGVRVFERNNLFLFNFYDKFLIKVKKLDEEMHASLASTQLSFDFDNNFDDQLCLDIELIGATLCYLGYVPNPRDHDNPDVWLVCPNGEEIYWGIPMTGGENNVIAVLPNKGPEEGEPQRVRVISPQPKKRENDQPT